MGDPETQVLIIGGGSTGIGVARDAAMRGLSTVLVDRGDLGQGTTARFHGILHSGGRYAVKDPASAVECIKENRVLRRIAAHCIEDTGGLFVTTPWDPAPFGDEFAEGCRVSGIPVEEIPVTEALRMEPRLNPSISRAFRVPDGTIDPWMTVEACARSAREHGAEMLSHHRVVRLLMDGDVVTGAIVNDEASGEEREIRAGLVVNAAGVWAIEIAAMARCPIHMFPGKGILIAMRDRLVDTVVNRCRMPSDGDIIVPVQTSCVIGTTDVQVDDPNDPEVTQGEVDRMLDEGDKLVPGFRQAPTLRAWAGVRPLFEESKEGVTDTRDVSRSHALLDHLERDGVDRFLSIIGGKLTTFRLMAEQTVDLVCARLGEDRPCRTDQEPLPEPEGSTRRWLGPV